MIYNPQTIIAPQQLWQQKFPTAITGLLSLVQCFITVVIIGCEVGSILIDIVTATIYVGFWASLFFLVAWISLAGSSCCCRTRGCASYTLIVQCISMFFALCVIGFDAYFIVNPTTCYFSSTICNSSASGRGFFYTQSNFDNIKIPCIKGQLGAGAVMFTLCLVYVIIYIISIRAQRFKQPTSVYPQAPYSLSYPPAVSNGILTTPATNHRPSVVPNNGDGRGNKLVCPTCSTVMHITAIKRPPI